MPVLLSYSTHYVSYFRYSALFAFFAILTFSCSLDPNPVARLTPIVDATNVTLNWERLPGRVDMYRLVWYQAESDPVSLLPSSSSSDDSKRRKRQQDPNQKRSVEVKGDQNTSYIDTLFPGTLYVIEMT